MTPKYSIDDLIFYMTENTIHSAPILSINIVQTKPSNKPEQMSMFRPFGEQGIWYATIHGTLKEQLVYSTREKLLESL